MGWLMRIYRCSTILQKQGVTSFAAVQEQLHVNLPCSRSPGDLGTRGATARQRSLKPGAERGRSGRSRRMPPRRRYPIRGSDRPVGPRMHSPRGMPCTLAIPERGRPRRRTRPRQSTRSRAGANRRCGATAATKFFTLPIIVPMPPLVSCVPCPTAARAQPHRAKRRRPPGCPQYLNRPSRSLGKAAKSTDA